MAWLNEEAFAAAGRKEADAEADAGESHEASRAGRIFTRSRNWRTRREFRIPNSGGGMRTAILPKADGM